MGAIVTLHRALRTGMAIAALLLAGCEEECVESQHRLPMAAPYSQFFGRLASCTHTSPPPVATSSSTGLTDSFTGSCVTADQSYRNIIGGCETTLADRRSSSTQASLYGFNFHIEIEQTEAGPQLLLRDASANSGTATTEITYRFQSQQAAGSTQNANSQATNFTTPPVVTELTNYASGGRTYAQVWRITNPLKAAVGKSIAVTAVYIDRDYGLIRFEQRDGTVWTLTP